jgi:hypothetical protein
MTPSYTLVRYPICLAEGMPPFRLTGPTAHDCVLHCATAESKPSAQQKVFLVAYLLGTYVGVLAKGSNPPQQLPLPSDPV